MRYIIDLENIVEMPKTQSIPVLLDDEAGSYKIIHFVRPLSFDPEGFDGQVNLQDLWDDPRAQVTDIAAWNAANERLYRSYYKDVLSAIRDEARGGATLDEIITAGLAAISASPKAGEFDAFRTIMQIPDTDTVPRKQLMVIVMLTWINIGLTTAGGGR